MARHDGAHCESFMVPVTVESVPDAKIYGELCVPALRPPPTTVQLLVHGTTYNHNYWDWPEDPETHSHVRAALQAGYATFNVDRLGVGQSTKGILLRVRTSAWKGLDVVLSVHRCLSDRAEQGSAGHDDVGQAVQSAGPRRCNCLPQDRE
jgi:pimeloyl-ACP methyl ester carboxylesterase